MVIAQQLKKNTENQSIAAAVLRCSVGRAKAASTARPGRPSINARSDPPIAHAGQQGHGGAAQRARTGAGFGADVASARVSTAPAASVGQRNHRSCRSNAAACGSDSAALTRQAHACSRCCQHDGQQPEPAIHPVRAPDLGIARHATDDQAHDAQAGSDRWVRRWRRASAAPPAERTGTRWGGTGSRQARTETVPLRSAAPTRASSHGQAAAGRGWRSGQAARRRRSRARSQCGWPRHQRPTARVVPASVRARW